MRILPFLGLLLLFTGCMSRQDRELVGTFNYDFYLAGRGTPAEYATGRVAGDETVKNRRILEGKLAGNKAEARTFLQSLLKEIQQGYDWPEKRPPEVTVPHLKKPPAIDGLIGEGEWDGALTFLGEYPLDSLEKSPTGAKWFAAWDEDYFYAAAFFPEPKPESDAAAPWKADALELFLGTDIRYRNYWETVVAPDGTRYDALCWNNIWNWYLSLPSEEIAGLKYAAAVTETGYSVEIAFPWKELPAYSRGNRPATGETIHFTLIRCRKGIQSSCHPLLYSGHNIFGHLRGILR